MNSWQHTIIHTGKFYKGVSRDLESPQRSGSQKLKYEVGKAVVADGLDDDPVRGCGHGINFCRTIAEALRWGPVVLQVSVPQRVKIIDTGGKLRAARVHVESVVDLSRADLSRADLSRADLSGAYLSGAYLSGAYLSRAYLSRADLRRADLSRAYLSRADLSRADLSGAYLSRADLSRAYLSRADLRRADLRRADLSRADLSRADLSDAKGDHYTQLPTSWKVNSAGLVVKS